MTDQDSEVKRIARDESFTLPPEAKGGRELAKLAERLVGIPGTSEQWFVELKAANTQKIVASMGALTSLDRHLGPGLHAFRDAARAMVEEKLADRMIAKMEALERVSERLGRRALFVGWVGIVAGMLAAIVGVVVAL